MVAPPGFRLDRSRGCWIGRTHGMTLPRAVKTTIGAGLPLLIDGPRRWIVFTEYGAGAVQALSEPETVYRHILNGTIGGQIRPETVMRRGYLLKDIGWR